MAQTVCIMPLDTAISSNCKSVNIYCIQCSWTYYVIAGLMNRELITGEQPFLFQFTFCVVFIYTVRRSNTHWGIIVSISLCSVCCASSNSSSTGLSLCLVVLVQSCVAGLCQAESHHKREGFRQQDNTRVCATAPEWRLALRSLSLDYHSWMHCWSERKADSLILLVGCCTRGRTSVPYCCVSVMEEKWVSWKLSRRACASELCEPGALVQFLGEVGGWLGLRHPSLCFGRVTTVREWI